MPVSRAKLFFEKSKTHWPLAVIFLIWFCVFFRMNTGQSVVGYRDSAYLYYPYFQWIDQQWGKGEIPLWNPYCDLGYPVVADGTSSVFYPGKLVFLLRFINYPARYGIYLSLHVFWAAVMAYILAYRFGANSVGAGIAGLSYSFGGAVLFQVTNVVYLVSASWLPLGILFVANMFKRKNRAPAIGAAFVAAMMVLGGDPQTAYLLGAVASVTAAANLIVYRKRYATWPTWFAKLKIIAVRLSLFAVAAFGLSAIQILPTYFWSQQSVRIGQQLSVVEKSLEPEPGSHLHAAYEFSQPPWSLVELFCPNVSGKPFPINQRWTNALPSADRIWSPSLFVGVVTFVLACGAFRFRGHSRRRVWLSWIGGWFAAAAFGWYGVVWLFREVVLAAGGELDIVSRQFGSQVGGIYWLMTIVLPGFDAFRYPAKLFTFASLAISVLAGCYFVSSTNRWRAICASVVVFAIACCGLTQFHQFVVAFGEQGLGVGGADSLFGPFDFPGFESGYRVSMICCAAVAAVVFVIINLFRKRDDVELAGKILFGLLAVELYVANAWLVPQVDAAVFQSELKIERQLRESSVRGKNRLLRVVNPPTHWAEDASRDRLAEIVRWQRETLHPKHHLILADEFDVEILNSFTSIENGNVAELKGNADISIGVSALFELANGIASNDRESEDVKLAWYNFGNDKFRLVKSLKDPSNFKLGEAVESADSAELNIDWFESRKCLVEVNSRQPVTLLCNILAESGWKIRVRETSGVESEISLKPAGPYNLAITFPAGTHKVEIYYSPNEFWIGAVISLVSCLAFVVGVLGNWFDVLPKDYS